MTQGTYVATANGLVGTGADDRAALNTLANTTIVGPGTIEFLVGTSFYFINSNVTIPKNVALKFLKGARLKPASGVTITINGPIEAGIQQIFDMSAGGNIVFGTANDVEANPVWFGALADFSGDSTVAFQKWALSGAKRLYIPWGQYDVRGTITLSTGRVHMYGCGASSSIYFSPTTDNVPLFQTATNDNVVIHDLEVFGHNTGSYLGLVGFDFANPLVSAVTFQRVYIQGFNGKGMEFDSITHLHIKQCRFLSNKSSSSTGAVAILIDGFVARGSIVDCRFSDNDKCMRLLKPTVFTIRECSFEGDGITSTATLNSTIEIDTVAGHAISFIGNYVEGPKTGAGYAFLSITDARIIRIEGNHFGGALGGITHTDRFIYIAGTNSLGHRVQNNAFTEVGTYFIEAPSHVVRAHDNYYLDGDVILSSYNSIMALMSGRVELNNYAVSTTIDVPSIANGAQYLSSDVAVTGAQLGDHVEATSNIDMAGLMLSAYVRAAGQVRFVITNNTGAAVNLGSATYSFKIIKND